jgi:uncharacterized membrane protein HdeD (DUF308 family)
MISILVFTLFLIAAVSTFYLPGKYWFVPTALCSLLAGFLAPLTTQTVEYFPIGFYRGIETAFIGTFLILLGGFVNRRKRKHIMRTYKTR